MDTDLLQQPIDKAKEENNQLVFSYLTLRNLIGFGGMLLPILLALLPSRPSDYYYNLEPSISDYFYTNRGDILVVMLCIIGTFMITYTGYSWKERLLSSVAGICAMGVAFVPTEKNCLECAQSVHTDSGGVFPTLSGTGWHFLFAAIFLSCTAIMSLVYFTKGGHTRDGEGTLTKKGKRNVIFKVCGWIIIVSLAILGIYILSDRHFKPFPMIYTFETIAVEAFGFSWLVKGQTLLPDGEHYLSYGFRQFIRLFK